eukprot:646778-Rhodomonas_salina.1
MKPSSHRYCPSVWCGSSLRAAYAVSGTDLAYAATSERRRLSGSAPAIVLRACYAMSGTDLA